jgi:hypothetical protein
MNPRLLTPAIVLVSFGAALGLMGRHSGLWQPTTHTTAAITMTPPAAPPGPPMTAAATAAPPPDLAPAPVATQQPDAAAEDAPPAAVSPEAQAQKSEGFLDARDRAAGRGARSH